jgi:parvulin-like peptidyl-prolyl isomerase
LPDEQRATGNWQLATMKRDAAIAIAVILIVTGVTYGLAIIKLDLKPIASKPYSTAAVGEQPNGHVIMRVNGEPVTEEEFAAVFSQLPEETQRQFSSPQGKDAFAEQMIRYKLLEQEARRMGVDRDPKVSAVIAAQQMDILANAAAQKLVINPTEPALRAFYDQHKSAFDSVDVSHILLAYQGGMVPPRPGHTAALEPQVMKQAAEIVKQLRAGANFAAMAVKESDDTGSVERGGDLGTFGRGQLPPEIEGRVFSMKEGEVSDPLPSRFGVHIFLVRKHGTQPFEQVRSAIAARVRNQNTLDRVEVLRRAAKVDFDPKVFPDKQKVTKKPS